MSETAELEEISFGKTVYDEDGEVIGHVRGFDEHGFYVSTDEGVEGWSTEHSRAGHDWGEAELIKIRAHTPVFRRGPSGQ